MRNIYSKFNKLFHQINKMCNKNTNRQCKINAFIHYQMIYLMSDEVINMIKQSFHCKIFRHNDNILVKRSIRINSK